MPSIPCVWLLPSLLLFSLIPIPTLAQTPAERLITDVRYLADDRLEGRLTGSPGADSAAAYIARRFAEAGLSPGGDGWFQDFTVSADAPAARHAPVGGARGRNVIGLLRGADPQLRNEFVVIGAHYDHLGLGGAFALDPDSTGAVHNGADDNASGTAALIEIAHRLSRRPPARSVAVVAFGGEELGLLGSAHYVREAASASRTALMLNLDASRQHELQQKKLVRRLGPDRDVRPVAQLDKIEISDAQAAHRGLFGQRASAQLHLVGRERRRDIFADLADVRAQEDTPVIHPAKFAAKTVQRTHAVLTGPAGRQSASNATAVQPDPFPKVGRA